MSSASFTASRMAVTVLSILTTAPRRIPCDGWLPMPTMSIPPSSLGSPTTQHILVVPISSPKIKSSAIFPSMPRTLLTKLQDPVQPGRTITRGLASRLM